MNHQQEILIKQFLFEISSVIEQLEHYDVVTKYVFIPEKSSAWLRYKAQITRDITYPYNNYLDLETVAEPFLDVLKKEYPHCNVDYIKRKGESGLVFERMFVIDWI